AVNKLVEYDLVAELGRLDAPGRPILFGTTENFLRHFGVSSLEELPNVDPLAKEDFKLEAEREVDEKLKMGAAAEKKSAGGKKEPETVGV
ncbi:MAG: SMC-Scp complex subunit ScpB, partial [Solobacterium sp.]|nr:SMC-Scp complex subunit ScpB [Solobacterium sp.]